MQDGRSIEEYINLCEEFWRGKGMDEKAKLDLVVRGLSATFSNAMTGYH